VCSETHDTQGFDFSGVISNDNVRNARAPTSILLWRRRRALRKRTESRTITFRKGQKRCVIVFNSMFFLSDE
jgi:hypothetical protein